MPSHFTCLMAQSRLLWVGEVLSSRAWAEWLWHVIAPSRPPAGHGKRALPRCRAPVLRPAPPIAVVVLRRRDHRSRARYSNNKGGLARADLPMSRPRVGTNYGDEPCLFPGPGSHVLGSGPARRAANFLSAEGWKGSCNGS
eukprot:2953695-Heterocapsa_arctica.AAC.1